MANEFSLVLGCGGYRYNNLILCSGTSNAIINFAGHFEQEQLNKIMDFLDNTCGLFDRPMGDWNKVANTIKLFYEQFKLIDDKTWAALHVWLPQHRRCGACLRLVFNTELDSSDKNYIILPQKTKY